MSDHACELCGLDLGGYPLPLAHGGNELRFCCEGCLGIYCTLHGIDAAPNDAQLQSPNISSKGA